MQILKHFEKCAKIAFLRKKLLNEQLDIVNQYKNILAKQKLYMSAGLCD